LEKCYAYDITGIMAFHLVYNKSILEDNYLSKTTYDCRYYTMS